jgi:hypothetical protein
VRTYRLYLINDEFASHYFGKERMLFQLFKDYEESIGELKRVIKKQIDFISKPIQTFQLEYWLNQYLSKNKGFYVKDGKFYLEMAKKSKAELEIKRNCLLLKADGLYDAETAFFEVLRKEESSFLAIDFEHKHCGWLKPIKERKFV